MPRDLRRRREALVASGVVGFAVLVLSGALPGRATGIVSDAAQTAVAGVAALACWDRRVREPAGRLRQGWLLLAASAGCWSAGQLVWTWHQLRGEDPFPSLADLGYLAAIPLALLAMWRLASGGAAARLRTAVDGLLIACALLFTSWAFVLGPTWRDGTARTSELLLGLAYPVGNLMVATLVLSVLARTARGPTPLALVGGGLVLLAVADSLFFWNTLRGTETDATLADVGWVAGYACIALAARRPAAAVARDEERSGPPPLHRLVLPYLPLGVAAVVAVRMAVTRVPADPVWVTSGLGAVVLVLVRQYLTLLENRQLADDLEVRLHELERREGELRHQAFHDPLTGLANRAVFGDRVGHALARARRTGLDVAVVFLDLDDFKTVNDSLGHAAGDELLVTVARRLASCAREGDTVARLGGDEFGVLVEGAAWAEAMDVAARFERALAEPFEVAGRQLEVRASMGVATSASGAETAEQLLSDADLALYAAKDDGKGVQRMFQPAMRAAVVDRLELGADLRRALARDELIVHYQPIVELATGATVACEALVRWQHPDRGLLAPAQFIPLAEESGLVGALGRVVLAHACAQGVDWRAQVPGYEVNVNLSTRQLGDEALVGDVAAALATSGLPPCALVLEITESVLLADDGATLARLHELRRLGVRLAIDDFGTGFSSLNYLRRLPADVLKVDRAFSSDAVLLESIITLGRTLGLQTVAEGIERQDQADQVRALGCDRAQGYLFAGPEPADVAGRRLGLAPVSAP